VIVISIPDDGDRRFRCDRDQFIAISGTVITMPRNDFHRGVALDITEGKLVSEGNLGERQRANQEIVHAQDQGSPTFKI
jgi:hypothetical protein